MGPKSSKSDIKQSKHLKFDTNEQGLLMEYYKKFQTQGGNFDSDKFYTEAFKNLYPKVKENVVVYLNDYYKKKSINKKIISLDANDFITLANILIKENTDSDDGFYFRRNTILILYDICTGSVENYQNNITINSIVDMFNFATLIYLEKYKMSENPFNSDEANQMIKEFLMENIVNGKIGEDFVIQFCSLEYFIDKTLYSLDGFLKNHFRKLFLQKEKELSYLAAFPIFTEPPSVLPTYKFFYFCLANPLISSKSYAFKLYDCKKNGYNIPNLIYSFLGFPGPVSIMVQHFEDDGKEVILGMFLNSNFKECYEKFCGDDSSFIFSISPQIKLYKFQSNSEKICFISSKNQKFSKVIPGIGMGFSQGSLRFWIDSNELFSKSYFSTYDDVFEEGSPLKESKQILNVNL